ncbi:thioredoxin-related protein [Mesoflavibacter sabulilitoris]|uniref:Thioredoxin family protein n=1 Tax=Mesoflavibacter zeaxanthinifaciens subsp. sabulilitoris TaxID=1520893 RepID=A0A2T1NH42_9FLAO|nr:thioredoxin family protein [Mesoflavibacter zeaxanthinifaciens]MBB3122750.1 thioredoxin-related protein [Mesoflavibacter zeaxanthinifaciens subsp. sabulilitoris]PSG92164.1 thioredoxin family protein [Mesoflavibacter zeaxanthinifaciens subsp. sabulilitoris]
MKHIIFIFSLFFSSLLFSQEEEHSSLNWLTDLNKAKVEATSSKKPILVLFTGSDWCAPCKMLKEDFFDSNEFETKSKQFVLLMIDIPRRTDIITEEQRKKNFEVVRKYNKEGSYPNLVALDDNLKVIGELSGYTFLRETDRHFAFIDSILENY